MLASQSGVGQHLPEACIIMLAMIMRIVMSVAAEWLLVQILPSVILRFSICSCFLLLVDHTDCTIVLYRGGVQKSELLEREQLNRLTFLRVSLLLPQQL